MSMKPTSELKDAGLISIGPSISKAKQLISSSREHRDIAAAKRFFTQVIHKHGPPEKITVDGYPATHTAMADLKAKEILPQGTKVRTSKYLNNLIEQDHRRIKQRIYPMLGFKRFLNAAIAI